MGSFLILQLAVLSGFVPHHTKIPLIIGTLGASSTDCWWTPHVVGCWGYHQCTRYQLVCLASYITWLVVWNSLYFPYIGNNNPNRLSYFSEGLKPRNSHVCMFLCWNLVDLQTANGGCPHFSRPCTCVFPSYYIAYTNVYPYVIIHLCHRTVRIYEIYNIDMYIYIYDYYRCMYFYTTIYILCIYICIFIYIHYYIIYIHIYLRISSPDPRQRWWTCNVAMTVWKVVKTSPRLHCETTDWSQLVG